MGKINPSGRQITPRLDRDLAKLDGSICVHSDENWLEHRERRAMRPSAEFIVKNIRVTDAFISTKTNVDAKKNRFDFLESSNNHTTASPSTIARKFDRIFWHVLKGNDGEEQASAVCLRAMKGVVSEVVRDDHADWSNILGNLNVQNLVPLEHSTFDHLGHLDSKTSKQADQHFSWAAIICVECWATALLHYINESGPMTRVNLWASVAGTSILVTKSMSLCDPDHHAIFSRLRRAKDHLDGIQGKLIRDADCLTRLPTIDRGATADEGAGGVDGFIELRR